MTKYLHLTMCLALATAPIFMGCGDDEDDSGSAGSAGAAGMNSGEGGTSGEGGDSGSAGTNSGGMGGSGGTAGTSSGGMGGSGGTAGTSSGGTGGGGEDAGPMEQDIVATAIAAGSFTKLAEALTAADLVETLQGEGPFTVFAPTDDAFEAFEEANPGVLAGLTTEQLTGILTYHVIAGDVASSALKEGGVAMTVAGSPVAFQLEGGAKILAGEGTSASITTADIECTNGVIHVIDAIILPPADDIVATAQGVEDFSTLVGAVVEAELVEALQGEGPLTVFAPTNAAFEAISETVEGLTKEELTNVLLYHVVDGAVGAGDLTAGDVATLLEGESVTVDLSDGAKINQANVTMANVLTKNGVIHVIDAVLVPE
jgi:transforming growth factor-beta-induced protein